MSNIENLEDHMALSCKCGCVRFNLLKSGGIECDDCGGKVTDSLWGQAILGISKNVVSLEPKEFIVYSRAGTSNTKVKKHGCK